MTHIADVATPVSALGPRHSVADPLAVLEARLTARAVTIGIVGLGYTGLPLAIAFAAAGLRVIGHDIDLAKIRTLAAGRSPLAEHADDLVAPLVAAGRLAATADVEDLAGADVVILSVPTPLGEADAPDLDAVAAASAAVARILTPGMLVILESTTLVGTTAKFVRPILEAAGARCGEDFLLAYSPERLCPGSLIDSRDVPRLVGGLSDRSTKAAVLAYELAFNSVVPVASAEVAEAAKLLENAYRLVNVSFINEVKAYFDAAEVSVWDVVAAAATKPYGFMPFFPGVGAGGHCIPVDAKYLLWSADQLGVSAPLLRRACDINDAMPQRIVERLAAALGAPLDGATVVVVGAAYKKNVPDTRESAAVEIMAEFRRRGARVLFHDPILDDAARGRLEARLGVYHVAAGATELAEATAILVCTPHDAIDFATVLGAGPPVFDPVGLPPWIAAFAPVRHQI